MNVKAVPAINNPLDAMVSSCSNISIDFRNNQLKICWINTMNKHREIVAIVCAILFIIG
jgi:hypothetical protein